MTGLFLEVDEHAAPLPPAAHCELCGDTLALRLVGGRFFCAGVCEWVVMIPRRRGEAHAHG
jgi:hypothetical protein